MRSEYISFSEMFEFKGKTSRRAGDGLPKGTYPFFTSSETQTKYLNEYDYQGPCIIMGTGGSANIHYCEGSFAASADCLVAQVKRNRADIAKFYYYFLKSNIHILEAGFKGAGLKHTSKGYLDALSLPHFIHDYQKKAVVILDKADAIRQKRQESIRLTDEFLRSVFLDMFGDPVTNTKRWDIIAFGDIVDFMTSGSRGWAQHYSESGARFLRIQNVGKNKLFLDDIAYVSPPENAEAKRTKVEAGDILFSITADLGRSAVIPNNFGEAYINQHLALLRVNRGKPLYYSAFIASEGGQRQVAALNKGGVKAGLNFNDIKSLQIPAPPDEMQDKWALIYKKQSIHVEKLRQANKMKDNLFNSLVQRAFRGEL